MSDSLSPLASYSSHLRESHASLVREYFEELLRISGVSEDENARLVSELQSLEASIAKGRAMRIRRVLVLIATLAALVLVFAVAVSLGGFYLLFLLLLIPLGYFLVKRVIPGIRDVNASLTDVSSQRDAKQAEAWAQMDPLNRLHTWDVGARFFQKAYTDVRLDRYMPSGRLLDLQSNFGLDPVFNQGKSILVAVSGDHRGNPFACIRYLQHWMGSKVYYGSIVIEWVENVRERDGRLVGRRRTQTLTASVEKPFPEFANRTQLIFGHEAAPNLSFTRTPSGISGLDDGFIANRRKDFALKKVERKARRDVKTGSGQLTVMANRDFETQFNALDRDHEVEFRLLFSAYAQQEMVKLLNDKSVGYSDDFAFEKYGRINAIEARHMSEIQFHGDPRMFWAFDLAQARKFFNEFHVEYFRSLFFSLAPLLTVPLYKEKRSSESPLGSNPGDEVSYWECEAMANFIGETRFQHPSSITQNIIRATPTPTADGATYVSVNAFGYAGIDQVDIVQLWGGDGNLHDVPVYWVEYVPVAQDTPMTIWPIQSRAIEEAGGVDPQLSQQVNAALNARGLSSDSVVIRNGLAAAIS